MTQANLGQMTQERKLSDEGFRESGSLVAGEDAAVDGEGDGLGG